MAAAELKKVINIIPQLLDIPYKRMWYSYDEEADILYLNFKKPSHADDSIITEDDIITRYEKGKVVGITIININASKIKTLITVKPKNLSKIRLIL
ncbi:MAG: DUF2283 domain-containing protein [Actinobacteria bacterium]|nr:DUF2283 domain-containing protein [Actinomycetota bacterium]